MTLDLWRCAGRAAALLIAAVSLALVAATPGLAQVEATSPAAIKPFKVHIPDDVLADLRRRLAQARWPDQLPGTTWEHGAHIGTVRALADHWQTAYDWRAQEARINRFDQFTTEIDGQLIHFIHQRSPRADAVPLLLLHGWPGSIVEFLGLIEPLTRPDGAAPAFHVVIPSLPGFGLSGPTRASGWEPRRMAHVFIVLMERLGYARYGVQGGDWGSIIAQHVAHQAPARVIGVHSNFLIAMPPSPDAVAQMSEPERRRFMDFQDEEFGYFKLQTTRPQTAAYGLADSPLGWLAWTAEKFHAWTDHGGDFLTVIDRDTFLTNATLYWATGTVASSLRIYREAHLAGMTFNPVPRFQVPVGHAVFPREIIASPYRWIDQHYSVVWRTEMPRGGHFAALEQPDLLLRDIRGFFAKVGR